MGKFIEELGKFFKKNWINISFVVVALFLILAIVAIKNIEFKDHPNKELEKIIMYEKFRGREGFREGQEKKAAKEKAALELAKAEKKKKLKGSLEIPAGSPDVGAADDPEFCKRTDSDLEKACKDLKEADCKVSDCCIYATPEDNAPECMAGDEHGATYNANKKSLEEWWYKGPKNEEAVRYPKSSGDFAPRKQSFIPTREPLEDTEAVAHQEEKDQEAEDEAIETIEQKAAIDMNEARSKRLMSQKHELENVKLKQRHDNEVAAMQDAWTAKNVAAKTREQTVNALAVVAKQKEIATKEREKDEAMLNAEVDRITAQGTGGGLSATDKQNIAKSRIGIAAQERELKKLSNEAKQQSQGELVGGEKVNGETNATDLAKKVTPESVGGKPNKALLLGIQDLIKNSSVTGDAVGKAAHGQLSKLGTNRLESLLPSKGNVAVEAFIGRARSGLTNYFR